MILFVRAELSATFFLNWYSGFCPYRTNSIHIQMGSVKSIFIMDPFDYYNHKKYHHLNCIIQTELSDVFFLIDQQQKNIHKLSEIDSEVNTNWFRRDALIAFTCSNTFRNCINKHYLVRHDMCVYKAKTRLNNKHENKSWRNTLIEVQTNDQWQDHSILHALNFTLFTP